MRRDDHGQRDIAFRTTYLVVGAVLVAGTLAVMAALTSASAQAGATATPPANTAPPAISGTPLLGTTLTATSGSWTGDAPITFAYQWRRCNDAGASCADISGATGAAWVVSAADVGFTLRVQVTAMNSAGSSVVQSAPTAKITSSLGPVNTKEPTISGTLVQGQTLTGTTGSWSGTAPISYAYQWVRCGSDGGAADGSNCAFISGATGATYVLTSGDVGSRMRLRVRAANSAGQQTVASNATGTVAASTTSAPKNTKEPSVSGTPRQGSTLTANIGGWSGTAPIAYAYQWLRCDGNGNNCAVLGGQTKSTFVPGASEVNTRIRVRITASNSKGSTQATSNPTSAVQASTTPPPPPPSLPAGAIKLPNGKYSIPVTSVSLPARLVIDDVKFTPNPVRSRSTPIQLRVHVVDTRGYVVRDALVYARSTPLVTKGPSDQPTAQDGWVTLQLVPRASFPLKSGYSVQFFVRARKATENLLAGVSTRRLVQVRTAR
jgi:hypothetical protein